MAHVRSNQILRLADLNLLDEQDAALAVDRLIYSGAGNKADLEREYLTNLDFLEGGVKAWYAWNSRSNERGLPEDLTEDELLVSFNLTLVQVETIVSRMFRPDPVWGALPIPGSEINAMRARMLEQALNYYYETGLNMPMVILRMLTMATACPIVWLTGGWEAGLGKIIRTTFDDFLASAMEDAFPDAIAQGSPLPDEARQDVIQKTQQRFISLFGEDALKAGAIHQHSGKLVAESFSVLEAYWYPWKPKDWEEVEFFVRRDRITVSRAADEYDLPVDEVRAMRSRLVGTNVSGVADFGRPRRRESEDLEAEGDMIDRKRFWRTPTLEYPDGVFGVYLGASGKVLFTGEIPNKDKIIPCFPLVEHFIPEKLSGTCLVTQTRSLALDTNKAASQDSAYIDQMIWPAVVTSEAGQVDGEQQEFTNRPGEHYKVTTMQEAPKVMDRPTVALDNSRRIDRNVSMMREVSSVAAIQVGKTNEANVRSGRAIDSLNQATNERLICWGRTLNKQQEAFATFIATELQTKPVGHQTALVNGLDNSPEMLRFTKDDLTPEVDSDEHTALIRVTAFSEVKMSRDMNTNFVLQLVKATVLQPGRDDSKIWRMLGTGDTKMFEDETRRDRARQAREIDLWRQGIVVPRPMPYEGHDAQIDSIIQWIRGGEALTTFKRFPYMAPHIYCHLRDHQRMKMVEQYKLVFLDRRARFEAWQESIRDAAFEANELRDPNAAMVFDNLDLLLPFEAVLADPALAGMNLGGQEAAILRSKSGMTEPENTQNQGGGTGPGGAGGQKGANGKPPEGPMSFYERDQRKDRSDSGVPREHVSA